MHAVAFANGVIRRVVDQAVRPRGRGHHRRILRCEQVESARYIPFYAQEFASRVGVHPIEVGACRHAARRHIMNALRTQQEGAHEDEEGDEARHRIARQADERGRANTPEGQRPTGLHRDSPHEQRPLGLDRGFDVIGIPHRHAARGHDDVALARRAAQYRARRVQVVGHDAVVPRFAVEHLRQAIQCEAVRVVDASRGQWIARHDELVAGEEQAEPHAPQRRQHRDADRSGQTSVLRPQARAGGEDRARPRGCRCRVGESTPPAAGPF